MPTRPAARTLRFGALGALGVGLAWLGLQEPRNDRDWWVETSRLPRIEIEGDTATIHDLRRFEWREAGFEAAWEARRYDLRRLEQVELMVEPFGPSRLLAHTMLGFDFGDQGRLVVSIEARKEKGESYGLLAGALRQFEIVYLFLDERDALVGRAVKRGSRLYAFPVRARPEAIRRLFLELAATANDLHETPRFYRSLFDNCTTAWVRHVDRHLVGQNGEPLDAPIGLRLETLFPGLTPNLLYDTGFMATDLPFEDALARFRIDERVRRHASHPEFSRLIRTL